MGPVVLVEPGLRGPLLVQQELRRVRPVPVKIEANHPEVRADPARAVDDGEEPLPNLRLLARQGFEDVGDGEFGTRHCALPRAGQPADQRAT